MDIRGLERDLKNAASKFEDYGPPLNIDTGTRQAIVTTLHRWQLLAQNLRVISDDGGDLSLVEGSLREVSECVQELYALDGSRSDFRPTVLASTALLAGLGRGILDELSTHYANGSPADNLLWPAATNYLQKEFTAAQNDAAFLHLEDSTRKALAQEALQQALDAAKEATEAASSTRFALEDATEAALATRQAAGQTGETALGTYFGTLGDEELLASKRYRFWTVLVAGLGAAGAIFFFVQAEWHEVDVASLVYRGAFLVGLASLSTYFGRLAGQHRRLANWARTIEVQLQSFDAFVSPVNDDSVRNAIYTAFAQRVLAAPPEKSPSDGPAPVALDPKDLLALLTHRGQ